MAGAGAAGPCRVRRRDGTELPLAMGGGCRARAPPAAGLRLLLAHAVLFCAAGSAAGTGSGTRGGTAPGEREGEAGELVPVERRHPEQGTFGTGGEREPGPAGAGTGSPGEAGSAAVRRVPGGIALLTPGCSSPSGAEWRGGQAGWAGAAGRSPTTTTRVRVPAAPGAAGFGPSRPAGSKTAWAEQTSPPPPAAAAQGPHAGPGGDIAGPRRPGTHDRAGAPPGPRPPRAGPTAGLSASARLLPAASRPGRGFSKERATVPVRAGSQGPSRCPQTHTR